jgi:hypothetical protein
MEHREAQILADAATVSIALGEGEMPDLPDISILVDEVKLPDDARHAYRDMEAKLLAKLESTNVLAKTQAVATGKLAQMANGFLYGDEGVVDTHPLHDEKADWLSELVEDLDGEPIILVYEYQADLALIRRLFGDVPYLGSGVSDKQAQQSVDDWNAGKTPILALHPASGGHGLNLQYGGSRMAWIAPTWSAEFWDQTIARIHRPGQPAHVMVHVCVAAGTVDELKRMRVIEKLSGQRLSSDISPHWRGRRRPDGERQQLLQRHLAACCGKDVEGNREARVNATSQHLADVGAVDPHFIGEGLDAHFLFREPLSEVHVDNSFFLLPLYSVRAYSRPVGDRLKWLTNRLQNC